MVTALNNINAYGLCGAAGFLLGIGYLLFAARVKSEDFSDLVYVYVWAAVGAVIGAKLLYILLAVPDIVRGLKGGADPGLYLRSMVSSGFVFYGGLLGALLAVRTASRYFGLDFCKVAAILTPALPLAHALGRVGCAVVGCCYGRETRMCIGISYTDSMYAPNGIRLFPVQIIEALADLLIFIVLVFILLKRTDIYAAFGVFERYLVMYACVRFLLEFMRGDSVRGHLGWFSTSQWISIIILLLVGIQKTSKIKWYEQE
ncbi:MAG: prolipoprotein diacylglyceryl transferase [Lachnospiraceae bacterium]|nr:prolipoprotein diacylglyceryl transferase [Lachnospiraceae bacterium]